MEKILVVGAGPGSSRVVTAQAAQALQAADVVFAAPRHAHLAPSASRVRPLSPLAQALEEMAGQRAAGKRVAVLVSGDPGLFSLLEKLKERFGAQGIEAVPGIGAVPFFAARLGESWQGARILSAHGRALSEGVLVDAVRRSQLTYLFLDGERGADWVGGVLAAWGLDRVRLAVGERLSYPDERIVEAAPSSIARMDFAPLSIVRAFNPSPQLGSASAGLEDSAFVRGKVPMSKRSTRVLILAALQLTPDAVVWDVGAGTGSVSVECARQCPLGGVWAVERSEEGASLIALNAKKFQLPNLHLVKGQAPEAFYGLPAPSHVFVGGSGGRLADILTHLRGLPQRIRLAATAVTLESVEGLISMAESFSQVEIEQIAVTALEERGGSHMLRAQNPIFLFSATKEAVP